MLPSSMLDPKNVSFDKLNKPHLSANARCVIVETVLHEHEKTNTLTIEQRRMLLRFGMDIVVEMQKTLHRVLDGEATLINGTGEFDSQEQLTACYTSRASNSEIAIGKRVSKPNGDETRVACSAVIIA